MDDTEIHGAISTQTTSDLKAVVGEAARVATEAVEGHTTETQTAISALSSGLVAVADHVIAAANPVAGTFASLASPAIVAALTSALMHLFAKIGIEPPQKLASLHALAIEADTPPA